MAASYIKGILKKILEPLLVGFSTKDLSLSFLGGNAKLRDIDVNVDAINKMLHEMQGVPVRFTRVHISELAVRASVSKIKSRPVELVLGEVLIEMEEPSVLLPPRTGRPPKPEAVSGQRYGTKDRIGDGMSVTIRRVEMVMRSKGLLKDAPIGPWTPPDLVFEFFDVNLVSCDAEGDSHGGNLAELYHKLANSKAAEGMTEIMVYKKATMKRMVHKLIPALAKYRPQTTTQAQSSAPQNQKSKDLEPVVLLDESPGPLKVHIAMRKRRADSILLGLLIKMEAIADVRMQLRDLRSVKMWAHVMTALTLMVNREGEIAWVNPDYLASLWAAVDAGHLPAAKVFSAQAALDGRTSSQALPDGVDNNGAKTDMRKTFTIVGDDIEGKSSMLEADLLSADVEDDADFEDEMEDLMYSASSHGGSAPGLRVGGLPPVGALVEPRTVVAFDIPSFVMDFGTDRTSGLDGGLRLALRDLNVEFIFNVEMPPKSVAAVAGPGSALACSNCATAHEPHPDLCDSAARAGLCPTDHCQMRIGSISLSSLASGSTPLLEIAVGTPPIDGSKLMAAASATEISNGQDQASKPSSGPALLPEVPTRWLQRGIERGFDPFADATSDSGSKSPASAPYALGMSMTMHKCGLGLPFGTISLNLVVDLPSPVKLCLNPALMSPLPDFFAAAADSRWFSGDGYNIATAPYSQPDATSEAGTMVPGSGLSSTATATEYCGRIEPMLLGAGSVMHLRLLGGMELTIPPPQDMAPSLPGLTLRAGAIALSSDRGRSRFGVLRPKPSLSLQLTSGSTASVKGSSSIKDSHGNVPPSATSVEEDVELGTVDPLAPLPPLLPARTHISLDGLTLDVTDLGPDYRTGSAMTPAITHAEGTNAAAAAAGNHMPAQSSVELLNVGRVLYVSSYDLPLDDGETIGANKSEVAESEDNESIARKSAIAAAWQATRVETSIDNTVATLRALQSREPQNSHNTTAAADRDITAAASPPPRPGLDQCYVYDGVPGAHQSVSVDTMGFRVCLDLPAMAAASQTVVHLVKSIALGSRTVASAVNPKTETSDSHTVNTASYASDATAAETPIKKVLEHKTTRVRAKNLSAYLPTPPRTNASSPSSSTQAVLSNNSVTELELKLGLFHFEVLEQSTSGLSANEVAVPLKAAVGVAEGLRLRCRDESSSSNTDELADLLMLDAAAANMNQSAEDHNPLTAEVQLGTCCVVGDVQPLCGAAAQLARRWSNQGGSQGCVVPVVLRDRSGGLFSDEVTLRTFLEGALSPSGPYLNMAVPFDDSYADGGAATEGGRDGEARRFSLSSNDASADEKDAELRSDGVASNDSVQLPPVALTGNVRVGAILLALPPPHAATKGASKWTVASFSNLQANVELPVKAQLGLERHAAKTTMEPSLRSLSGSVSATVSMAQVTPNTNGSLDHRSNNRSGICSNIWCEEDSGLNKMLVAPFSTSVEICAEMLDNVTAHALLSHFLDTIAIEFAVSPQRDNSAMIPLIQRRAGGNEATAHADSISEYESALAAAGLGFPVGRQPGEITDGAFLASSSSTDGAGDSQGTEAPLPPPPQQYQQLQLPFDETHQPASMAALAANLPARVAPRLLAFVREQTQSVTALQDVLESEGWQFPTSDSPESTTILSRSRVPADGNMSSSNDTPPPSTASAMAYDATASALGQHTQAARLLCDELRASLQSAQSSSGDAAAATLAKANEVQQLLNQAANLQERTAAAWAAHAADLTARARAAAAAEAKAAAMLASSEAQRVEDHEARRRANKALTALEARRVADERQHKEALAALEGRLREAEKRATGRAESGGTPSLPTKSKGRPSMLGNWMPSSS